jgi:ABC-type amino acid transport substrate-binding protein
MKIISSALIIAFLFYFSNSFAQKDTLSNLTKELKIGVFVTPPFVMKNNGSFNGLSISSWELVNKNLQQSYEYIQYESLKDLLEGIERKEVDFSINPVTVTDSRMNRLAFSQPYFISKTSVAKRKESQTWTFIQNLWSWNFISAVLILIAVIFIFGVLVWIFERHKNKEEFGGKGLSGIKEGFWWSAVTMTTVGYGDRSPRTTGGRIVGLVWMFAAIIMISSLTAGIASALTVQGINNSITSVEDLSKFKTTTVANSSAEELLELYGIKKQSVFDEKAGVQKLLDKETDVFVYDEPIISYELQQRELSDEIEILPQTLKKDYYSYTFPKGSDLLSQIDPVLVSTLKTMEWSKLLEKYQ